MAEIKVDDLSLGKWEPGIRGLVRKIIKPISSISPRYGVFIDIQGGWVFIFNELAFCNKLFEIKNNHIKLDELIKMLMSF